MPFHRRTTAFAKPSNARSVQARVIWLSNVLIAHSVQFANRDLTPSNNASTTCSIALRPHQFARSSPGTRTLDRMSVIPTETTITIAHDHRIDDAGTTITVEMTAGIAIATTGTTIMIVTTMIGMTGMIGGTHVTIGETETATHATIEGTTTTADEMLLQTTSGTPMHLGPTHHQTRQGINRNSSHTQTGLTPATRPTLRVLNVTNSATMPRNAQQPTVAKHLR
mgnify:CR=1 FL=1